MKGKDVELHCKQLFTLGIEKQLKKKSSSLSQMATQSQANVKRTHMTARAPVRKSTARKTRWICRWLYVHGDDGKNISNVPVLY